MTRILFEKTGSSVWISHLDLMRLFQRAFCRAGLVLKHTQGFNPRPSVSIALPLSVGIESHCELLDFELEGMDVPCEQIVSRLNDNLTDGIRVLQAYPCETKIKNIALMDVSVVLEYDNGVPKNAECAIRALFERDEVVVEKKSKKGDTEQNIIPLMRSIDISAAENTLTLSCRICCQNPTLNPTLIGTAIEKYLPEMKPNFITYTRLAIYDADETEFR